MRDSNEQCMEVNECSCEGCTRSRLIALVEEVRDALWEIKTAIEAIPESGDAPKPSG